MSRWGFGCALAALLCALPAAATTIVRVTDADLVDEAPLVVVAEVVSRGRAASGAAATDYRFSVERVLKGSIGPELTVSVPGGVGPNGVARRVHGAPSFAPGERAILFLRARPEGEYRVLHLMQGAFREVRRDGRSLALRDLADVAEVRLDAGATEPTPAAAAEPVRDFDAFVRWIEETARGAAPAADYRVAPPAREAGEGRVAAPFTLFRDGDGTLLRWFEFDTGGSVPWLFGTGGQPGVPGGGQAEFQAALQAWNADPQTPIGLGFAGQSSAQTPFFLTDDEGNAIGDGLNVLMFGDPFDELDDLNASCAGTLAIGGSLYNPEAPRAFRGQTYYPYDEGDIVINNGLACFFNGSPDARKAAEELFGHELGHTIGIDHSCGDQGGTDPNCGNPLLSDALMRAFVHDDARGARLNSDDVAAARALYAPAPSTPGTVPAAPSNLTAEAISAGEIELAWQDESANETVFAVEVSLLGGSFFEVGVVPANETGAIVENLDPATGYLFRVRARNDVGTSAPSNVAQASTDAIPGACVPGAQTLCLAGGRFQVDAEWATTQATSGAAQVVPNTASDDSGLFYFFAEANWELVVKVLNACVVNERIWVFAGGLTNVETVLRVIDTDSGRVKHYFNPQETAFQPVQDTAAFATCP